MPIYEPIITKQTFINGAKVTGIFLCTLLVLRLVAYSATATCANSFLSGFRSREENPDSLNTAFPSRSVREFVTHTLFTLTVVAALVRAYGLEHAARSEIAVHHQATALAGNSAALLRSPRAALAAPRRRRLALLLCSVAILCVATFPLIYSVYLRPLKTSSGDYECALGTHGGPFSHHRLHTPGVGTAVAVGGATAANGGATASTRLPVPKPNGVSGHTFYIVWASLWVWYASALARNSRAAIRALHAGHYSVRPQAHELAGAGPDAEADPGLNADADSSAGMFLGGFSTSVPAATPGEEPEQTPLLSLGPSVGSGGGSSRAADSSTIAAARSSGRQSASPAVAATASASADRRADRFASACTSTCTPARATAWVRSPSLVARVAPVAVWTVGALELCVTLRYAYHTPQQVLLGAAAAVLPALLAVGLADAARIQRWDALQRPLPSPVAAEAAATMGTGAAASVLGPAQGRGGGARSEGQRLKGSGQPVLLVTPP